MQIVREMPQLSKDLYKVGEESLLPSLKEVEKVMKIMARSVPHNDGPKGERYNVTKEKGIK
jgi:DNA-binding PadR family transcriptional regulator